MTCEAQQHTQNKTEKKNTQTQLVWNDGHIQLIMWYVCHPNTLTRGNEFVMKVIKIHLQPEYWDKQFTVTNLHTRIDSS